MHRPVENPSLRHALHTGERSFSFEFFPPKTDAGERQLWQAIRELEGLHPTFVSVTYGAGGSTRDRTVRITHQIQQNTTVAPVAHLTCVGASVDDLHAVIAQYADAGVSNVLAIRGDPPGGLGRPWVPHAGGYDHAVQLVSLLKELGNFTVGVAAFPEGPSRGPGSAVRRDGAPGQAGRRRRLRDHPVLLRRCRLLPVA
ncbi:MAG: methylenetetrahydrofolate reductase [Candidatus Nanopelagicales bacterium]